MAGLVFMCQISIIMISYAIRVCHGGGKDCGVPIEILEYCRTVILKLHLQADDVENKFFLLH